MNFSKSFKKSSTLKLSALLLVSCLFSGNFFSQAISEGFESTTVPATSWTYASVTHGTNSPRTGLRCATFNGNNDAIVTPLITNPAILTFYYKRSGTAPGTPVYAVYKGASATGPWTQVGSNITTFTTTYASSSFNFTGETNIFIRILHTRSSGTNEIYLDDVSVTANTSPTPTIVVTPATLTGFTYGFGSGPSANQTFTCSGTLLTSNIALAAPTNYEISLSAGSGFGASLALTPSSGTVAATTIYVRLKSPLAVANYNSETVVCSSTGATPVNVVCSGNVTSVLPEINLKGNATSIVDGDASPATTDHTDFGSIAPAGSLTRTFTIENTGNSAINISGPSPYVVISGADAADFSITTSPSNSIAGAGSTNFVVTFTSAVLGLHSAILTINSNDSDEAIYNFSIQATVATPPTGVVAAAGDFRPLYSTDLSINGSWEYYNGSSWVAVPDGKAPQNTITTINRVIINTYVGGAGSDLKAYNCDFIIESGGELNLVADDVTPTSSMVDAGKKIEVLSGGLLNVQGDISVNVTGSIIVRTGGAMILDQNTLTNVHPFWSGIELFENESTVTLKNWDWAASPLNRSLINSSTSMSSNADGYKFGNFIFDASPTGTWTLLGSPLGIINLCENNLEIKNPTTFFIGGHTNKTGTNGFLVNGDMIIHDGPFSFGSSFTSDAFNHQFVINGNFLCSSNDDLKIHHSGSGTPTNLTGKVTFKGNVTVASTVNSFTNSASSANTRMYVDYDGGTIASPIHVDIAPVAVAISMNVLTNSFVKLRNNHLVNNSIASNTAIFTVQTGGSFHFNWAADGTTPLVVRKTTTSPLGTNNFISKIGSDLYITSTWGIMANPHLLGNVQMETRTYESLADFHYIGLLSQEAGNGLPVDIRNLEINNTGATGNNHVYLSNFSKIVHNTLKMQLGNIITDLDTIIILGSSTAELGTLDYTSGFVIGRMKRWFNSTNSGIPTGLFPMGVTPAGPLNRHCLIEFTSAPSAGGHLTVEFIPISMGIAGLTIPAANTGGFGFDVIMTEDQGYWKIDNEATKLVDGTYTIACTGEGFTTITDLTKLTLLKRVGGTDWFCPGTHVASSGTIAVPTCTRTGVSNWSNFGFSSALGNILPIELISFDSECGADKFTFNWASASERDNDFYTIEKSDFNSFFSEIARIDGAGNSSQKTNYDFSISNADNGYYRLSQTDFNGKKTILETIYVNCISNSSIVFPNPSAGLFTIQMSNIEEVMVYNQLGQEVKKVKQSSQLDLTELSNGIYNLRIFNGFDSKFVKIEIVK